MGHIKNKPILKRPSSSPTLMSSVEAMDSPNTGFGPYYVRDSNMSLASQGSTAAAAAAASRRLSVRRPSLYLRENRKVGFTRKRCHYAQKQNVQTVLRIEREESQSSPSSWIVPVSALLLIGYLWISLYGQRTILENQSRVVNHLLDRMIQMAEELDTVKAQLHGIRYDAGVLGDQNNWTDSSDCVMSRDPDCLGI